MKAPAPPTRPVPPAPAKNASNAQNSEAARAPPEPKSPVPVPKQQRLWPEQHNTSTPMKRKLFAEVAKEVGKNVPHDVNSFQELNEILDTMSSALETTNLNMDKSNSMLMYIAKQQTEMDRQKHKLRTHCERLDWVEVGGGSQQPTRVPWGTWVPSTRGTQIPLQEGRSIPGHSGADQILPPHLGKKLVQNDNHNVSVPMGTEACPRMLEKWILQRVLGIQVPWGAGSLRGCRELGQRRQNNVLCPATSSLGQTKKHNVENINECAKQRL